MDKEGMVESRMDKERTMNKETKVLNEGNVNKKKKVDSGQGGEGIQGEK